MIFNEFDVYWDNNLIGYLYTSDNLYKFKYEKENIAKIPNFDYLRGFNDIEKVYESNSLFPVFKERIPSRSREDIDEILGELSIDKYDEVELLKKTNAKLLTDKITIKYEKELEI